MSRSMFVLVCVAVLVLAGCPGDPPTERTVSTSSPMLDATLSTSFWDLPWPSDARVTAAGTPDMAGFPNPEDSNLINSYLAFCEETLDGFGASAPVYLRFDGAVTLPAWDESNIEASQRCEGPVRILDVDPESPGYGTCLPARWELIEANSADPFLAGNVAIVAPYWGFPMRGRTTYAVYLVDLEGPGGYVQGSTDLQALLSGAGPAALQPTYQPLADYLLVDLLAAGVSAEGPIFVDGVEPELPADGIDRRWIAHATVFTTQDATGELQAVSEFVAGEPGLIAWEGDLTLLPEDHEEHQDLYAIWDGTYRAPNFQRGELPYGEEGGGFEFDDTGAPIVQLDELIPFAVSMPRDSATQPAAGWPVILHQHGTGGDRFSHLSGNGSLRPGLLGANRGFVSIGIPQPFHGGRWPDGNDTSISILSFNFSNPESGRSTFRQGATDLFSLLRFVQESMAEGGPLATAYPDLRIDPDNVYFLGHSQGGLTGALALPFLADIKGWVLSGAGGGLSITVMQREDPVSFRDLVLGAIGDPAGTRLTEMHPVLGLVQMLVEATDPVNYAPLWIRDPLVSPASVLLTEGIGDDLTPPDASEAMAVAAGLPPADPYRERDVFGLQLRGLSAADTPYSGNVESGGVTVTAGLAQFDSNHYAIFNIGEAASLWANFLKSFVDAGPPGELGYSP